MPDATSVGLAAAFAAGIVSFLSPCVLPIVPGYLSYIAGQSARRVHARLSARFATLGASACFVAGFGTVFVAFGASATAIGQLFARHRYELNIAGGIVIVAFGLLMLGMLRWVSWLQRDLRFHPRIVGGHPVAAYVLGLAFGFGWTPCIGPVLGAILMASAAGGSGVALLAAYALGLGVPFLLAALFLDRAARLTRRMRTLGVALQIVGGAVLVAFGIAMITGYVSVLSNWLLEAFPALGRIG
ncbi:MAG TPA: cytochrome c biogenesis protein CcdA [Burkholderiales bacterium]|nr:cytochrome c biogenesis protein CcdA [Burkholderiales bacterium]